MRTLFLRRLPVLRRLPALPVILVMLALVASGCDVFSTTASPLPSGAASPGATDTASGSNAASAGPSSTTVGFASATPGSSGGPDATPVPRPSPKPCTPEAPTDLSREWKTLTAHDGDFTFKYPQDWEQLYGAFLFQTTSLLDATTLAETGLPGDHTTKADLVRAPGTGLPNASVLIVPGVLSAAPDIYLRQELRFRQIEDAVILRADQEACLDGLTAYGVEFVFGAEETLQQSWYVVHNGRSYDFQWLATKAKPDREIFMEMFRTWKWTPNFPEATPRPVASSAPSASAGPRPSGPTAFVTGGMAASITSGAAAPDPATFTNVLSKDLTSIYAVFVLEPGLTGRVEGELLKGDRVIATLAVDYMANHTWGDFRINSADGFQPGTDYRMRIRFVPTGEEVLLPFRVE